MRFREKRAMGALRYVAPIARNFFIGLAAQAQR
jgi:hypothetical protein